MVADVQVYVPIGFLENSMRKTAWGTEKEKGEENHLKQS